MLLSTTLLALAATATAQLDAVKIVKQIAPNATNCPETKECRTAEQAAPFIAKSMTQYGVYCTKQMAGIISLMAFESVDFKYKHNVFPGRPGQGTANMQMANFNLMYAKSIDGVKDQVKDITTVDGASNDTLNHILSLVQPDQYNFGSGPWFFTTQCKQDVKDKFKKSADEGFAAYMQCVGVSVTDERKAYFERAKKAFGVS